MYLLYNENSTNFYYINTECYKLSLYTITQNKALINQLTTLSKSKISKILSNFRLAKILLNINKTIQYEIDNIYKKSNDIQHLSFYSIAYLLTIATNKAIKKKSPLYNFKNTLLKSHSVFDLYTYISKFNITHNISFSYKCIILLSLLTYITGHETTLLSYNSTYFKQFFKSLNKCSSIYCKLYSGFIINIFSTNYIKLLNDCNITNPFLLSSVKNITNKILKSYKHTLSKKHYYSMIIIMVYYNFTLNNIKISDIIAKELNTIVIERIKIPYLYQLYLLYILDFTNFTNYIISNNIVISKHLVRNIFEQVNLYKKYEHISQFYISSPVDINDKFIFFIQNNIPINITIDDYKYNNTSKSLIFDGDKCHKFVEYLEYNKIISKLDFNLIDTTYLNYLLNYIMSNISFELLTARNQWKLYIYNPKLYDRPFT